jgi:hypothetical protein
VGKLTNHRYANEQAFTEHRIRVGGVQDLTLAKQLKPMAAFASHRLWQTNGYEGLDHDFNCIIAVILPSE